MSFASFSHHLSKEKVTKNLLSQDSGDFISQNPQFKRDGARAAVLVPLFFKQNQLHVLLTRRSENLRTAPGEVSFPGGKRDPGDKDDIETALRETQEEIGIPPQDVQVVSRLPPMFSINSLIVIPVVGFVPDDCLTRVVINQQEVQQVFSVPVAMFLSKKYHHSTFMNWPGRFEYIHFFQRRHGGKKLVPVIFGLTAYICISVACVIYKKDPGYQMETTFNREDLEVGFVVSFSVLCISTYMDICGERRRMSKQLQQQAVQKAKL